MHQRQMLRLNDNCAVFEAWANMFLFFVYETRFFFVCFCFVKLRQTAGIVDDKEKLNGIQAYVKLETLITSLGKTFFGFCHFVTCSS